MTSRLRWSPATITATGPARHSGENITKVTGVVSSATEGGSIHINHSISGVIKGSTIDNYMKQEKHH